MHSDYIFVFGSNLSGIHRAGAALDAVKKYGALYGQGVGLQGNSYAIPTKDHHLDSLSIPEISFFVNDFIKLADERLTLKFKVTKIGCGFAGYSNSQMAPLFSLAPLNCWFDEAWKSFLGVKKNYWGTYL